MEKRAYIDAEHVIEFTGRYAVNVTDSVLRIRILAATKYDRES
jgi:hypothetical protein